MLTVFKKPRRKLDQSLRLVTDACRVNAVVPGTTETQALIQWAADSGMTPAGVVQFQTNHIVLQRRALCALLPLLQ